MAARSVEIKLQVRRFSCDAVDWLLGTFTEQVDGLTSRYIWRSLLLHQTLEKSASRWLVGLAPVLLSGWGWRPAAARSCAWSEPCLPVGVRANNYVYQDTHPSPG
jgi:hypothetical protein